MGTALGTNLELIGNWERMVRFGKDSRGVADAVDLCREDCGVCSWKYVRKTEEKSEGNKPEGPNW